MIKDKRSLLSSMLDGGEVYLELGCGDRKRHPEAIGIDALDFADVDVVGDVYDVLASIKDSSIAGVYSYHFFEHIQDFEKLFLEVVRVVAPGGSIKIVVPHHSNAFYYSDITHKTFFGLYTMSYFCEDSIFRRTVPRYMRNLDCHIESINLIFKSYRPRYIRHIFRKFVGAIVNMNSYTKEFYEENLSGLVSCYEIEFYLRKKNF